MLEPYRTAYNEIIDDAFYRRYLDTLSSRLGCAIPFRVAETPFFVPSSLRDRLAESARAIVGQVLRPDVVEKMKRAIPPRFDVPRVDASPHCIQVDFAIVQNDDGSLDGRVVELQAFPSLYGLMVVQHQVIAEQMRGASRELDRPFSIYFDDLDTPRFVERFRRAVCADVPTENVVLLDLAPETQKTFPDFAATQQLIGIDSVCPTTLRREGRKLFREKNGRKIEVARIYNRIVFDELERLGTKLPFDYTDDLDVSWCSHPNWYWIISKYSLPFIDHPAVPRARTLREIGDDVPANLDRYVLKPLFSFAGAGVKVDVERADVDAIPDAERDGWILQEKIVYHPGIRMPEAPRGEGGGVKAEVRMMFLRDTPDGAPRLVLNLVRLSRGKMLGVDQNKNLTWVGGSVGLFEASGGTGSGGAASGGGTGA